jgi:hypothetical protein
LSVTEKPCVTVAVLAVNASVALPPVCAQDATRRPLVVGLIVV